MLQTKKANLTGKQKAAIFIVSLGQDVAAEVMKHLREDEVEALTFEIARMEKVTPEDVIKVIIVITINNSINVNAFLFINIKVSVI